MTDSPDARAAAVPPKLPPPHLRDPGDAWVEGPSGQKFWGRFGAAGLLVWHRDGFVLLQHRALWSHHGGTWGIPGGARKQHENATDAAFREANEEAGVPRELQTVIFETVFDLGFWSYTTVVVETTERFGLTIADAESVALAWVQVEQVEDLELHPGFASSWPALRERLH